MNSIFHDCSLKRTNLELRYAPIALNTDAHNLEQILAVLSDRHLTKGAALGGRQ